ncbi:MAG TPA: hypothetical protein VJI46_02465 [Candidatus Nanoarchaeia archaeon]|nr:hypothetical protein [Candidatus Nanoarchaeia archaeon]
MEITKTIGYSLIGLAVVLLALLIFVKSDVDEQAATLCVEFHENDLPMEECPAHTSNVSWLIVSAFAISFLILGVGIYLLFIPKASEKREFKHVDASKFDEEERKFYDIIRSKGGSAYQTDLIKETGFSKVKVSRILDKLESQEVLERKRRGMTNIVVLK